MRRLEGFRREERGYHVEEIWGGVASRLAAAFMGALLCAGLLLTAGVSEKAYAQPAAGKATTVSVCGQEMLSSNSRQCGSGTAQYDATTNTLTLNNATINWENTVSYMGAINVDGDLTVNLVGANVVTSSTFAGVKHKNGTLTITGSGSLEIVASAHCALYSDNDVVLQGVTVKAKSAAAASNYKAAIYARDILSIEDSEVTAESNWYAIDGEDGLSISDGSTVSATAGACAIVSVDGEVIIDHASVVAKKVGENDSYAASAGTDFEVRNGGVLTLESVGSGLHASGDIVIEGSMVKATVKNGIALYSDGGFSAIDSNVDAIAAGSVAVFSASGFVASGGMLSARSTANFGMTVFGNVSLSDTQVEAFGSVEGFNIVGKMHLSAPSADSQVDVMVVGKGQDADDAHHFASGDLVSPFTQDTVIEGAALASLLNDHSYVHIMQSPRMYQVALDPNGGTLAEGKNVTSYVHGTGVALPSASDVTRDGHTFKGWFEIGDFGGVAVTEISADSTGDKSYTACWEADESAVGPADAPKPADTATPVDATKPAIPRTGDSAPFMAVATLGIVAALALVGALGARRHA